MSAGAIQRFVSYANLFPNLKIPKAGRFQDFLPLVKSSATGGLLSGGLTTLFTGNPLAGLAVGVTDTLGSAALATGIGALGGKTGTRKLFGKDVNFRGGKKYTFSETDDLDPLLKQLQTIPNTGVTAGMKDDAMNKLAAYIKSKEYYSPSGPQLAGMYAGSIAAPYVVEPMFYPKPQSDIAGQQLFQRYRENAVYDGSSVMPVAPGTLYQTTLVENLMGGM